MDRSTLRWPFWNDDAGQARAVWRVLVPLALSLVAVAASGAAVADRLDVPWTVAVQSALAGTAAVAIVACSARFLDRGRLADYGFHVDRRWLVDFVAGLAIGVAATGGALAVALALGWAEIEAVWSAGTGSVAAWLLSGAVGFAFVGLWEELVFRGVLLRNSAAGLARYLGSRGATVAALVLSAVLFGVLHAEQAGSALALSVWIGGGLALGVAYVLTDELALPIGMHATINFGYNPLFGLSTPVTNEVSTVVRPAFVGPEWAIGGGGVLDVLMFAIAGVLAVAWVWATRGRVDPRRFLEGTVDRESASA